LYGSLHGNDVGEAVCLHGHHHIARGGTANRIHLQPEWYRAGVGVNTLTVHAGIRGAGIIIITYYRCIAANATETFIGSARVAITAGDRGVFANSAHALIGGAGVTVITSDGVVIANSQITEIGSAEVKVVAIDLREDANVIGTGVNRAQIAIAAGQGVANIHAWLNGGIDAIACEAGVGRAVISIITIQRHIEATASLAEVTGAVISIITIQRSVNATARETGIIGAQIAVIAVYRCEHA
jgi:hypothetical protein